MDNKSVGKLGFWDCVGILAGGMIGSAIYSLSGITIAGAGPASVLSWIIGGIIMLAYGLIMAELSVRYPRSGGMYVFPARAFGGKKGRYLGWISCWSSILTNIVAVAFAAIYVGTYLSVSFPVLENFQIPLALLSVAICCILNCIDFSLTGKINTIVVTILLCTMLTYISVCLFSGDFHSENFIPFFSQGNNGNFGFISAIPTAIIAYSAIVSVAFMVSEIKKPQKNIPQSMIIALTIVAIIYSLMLIATIGVISATYLIENPGMQYIPVFAACFNALSRYPWLTPVISVSAVLALMTTMLVCTTMNARALKAAAEDEILPKIFSSCTQKGVPAFSTVITCVLAGIISCFPSFTETIVGFGAIFNCITLSLTTLALPVSRKKTQLDKGSFHAPGGKILPYAVLVLLILCNISDIISGKYMLWVYTLGFLLIGTGIFFCKKNQNR